MRELKFRVWDKRFKQFIDNKNYELYEMIFYWTPSGLIIAADYINEIIIQQFTGLKDKNGTEIYEGDIVEYSGLETDNKISFYIINYNVDYCAFLMGDFALMRGFPISGIKVVGNIFENPELLNEKI